MQERLQRLNVEIQAKAISICHDEPVIIGDRMANYDDSKINQCVENLIKNEMNVVKQTEYYDWIVATGYDNWPIDSHKAQV